MGLFINLKKLKELCMSPSMYAYLYSMYYGLEYELATAQVKAAMDLALQKLGYLKIAAEGIVLRSSCKNLFEEEVTTEEGVNSWINDWRELFPKGVKSGNRPVRGDRRGVLAKMKTFIKNYPDVTKEQIFDATKQYVFDASVKGYQFIICADYFIDKNNNSVLGAMIEDIVENGSILRNSSGEGDSHWHKEI